mmetsp:Transcript_39227/g.77339  ORF Transcript_39227/g.77339 Transcript_39227/m.77339 type:complete len:233 (-) Transcript_39227:31-729(-)
MVMVSVSPMISPLVRHSFLLSSSTVFMFSIQIASTGPSMSIHLSLSPSWSLMATRIKPAKIPSCHSLVLGSNAPYSCPMVMLFGFITRGSTSVHFGSSGNRWCSSASVAASPDQFVVLPANGAPTIMKPCLTTIISYVCTTFSYKYALACVLRTAHTSSNAPLNKARSGGGTDTPGNRSEVIPLNKGTSGARNLHRFTSMMERSTKMSSDKWPSLRFKFPAALSTAITARMP